MVQKQQYVLPDDLKRQRCCLRCHLVKTEKQFNKNSCENCQIFHGYDVPEYTTESFGSIVCITNPQESWFAQQIGAQSIIPGCYAINVRGTPSQAIQDLISEFQNELEAQ